MKKIIVLTMGMVLFGGIVRADESNMDKECETLLAQSNERQLSLSEMRSKSADEQESLDAINKELAFVKTLKNTGNCKMDDRSRLIVEISKGYSYQDEGYDCYHQNKMVEISDPKFAKKVQALVAEVAQEKAKNVQMMIAVHKQKYSK